MAQKSILTSVDIASLVNAMKLVFPTKDEVPQMIKDEIKHLPTKDDFYTRMDKLSGEYKKIDEAETLHAGTISEHSDELDKHEQRIKALETRQASHPTSVTG